MTKTETKLETPAPFTMPAAPKKIDLSFNLLELSDKIKIATDNVTAESNLSETCKRLRRALLSDSSYDGRDKNAHVRVVAGGTLTTAKEFLSVWEQGLIHVDGGYDPNRRDLGGLERLQFKPDNSGQTFNMAHSHNYVMGAPVVAASNLALQHGWKGETETVIANRLRAARERLEILRESLPSSETIASVESYTRAVYASLAARVESVSAPFAAWISASINPSAPIDLGFLSALAGVEPELGNVKALARRWMLTIDDGGISTALESMRAQMGDMSKQLQSRAEEIETQRSRLGK